MASEVFLIINPMQKLYSQLIGLPVFDEASASNSPLALIQNIIVDPESGKVLAFLIKNHHIIVPVDVERLGSGLFIVDRDRIVPLDDVMRVHEVFKMHIGIIGARVITEREKRFLGRVVDYEIDTTHMVLTHIHVAKLFLFFRFQERIISYRHIIRIDKHTVVVKDLKEFTVKEKARARSQAYAA